jgi:hypothetical protein
MLRRVDLLRRRLGIEVGIDAIGHGLSDIAVLDEEVLGVLWEQ